MKHILPWLIDRWALIDHSSWWLIDPMLVLLVTFCWQNLCHISVLLKQGHHNHSESYKILRAYFLNYGKTLIWQVSVSQPLRRQFPDSRKILHSLQLNTSRFPSCRLDGLEKCLDALSVREDFEQLIRHDWWR